MSVLYETMEMMAPSKPRAGRDDLAMVAEVVRGVHSAREALATRLYPRVTTTVRYLAGTSDDIDDIIQLSLIEILRSVGGYRGDASLERWCDRVTVRVALRQLKRRRAA